MPDRIRQALEAWLDAGIRRIGQVVILPEGGSFRLTHQEDAASKNLRLFRDPEDAIEIARFDDQGAYRPLKSAPNLRHGWELRLDSTAALHRALDYFYPAMLGALLASRARKLTPVCLRETLGRQSGMYAITRKIGDEEADALISEFCTSDGRCVKTILWEITPGRPVRGLPVSKFDLEADQLDSPEKSLPLPCAEACNLLVAAARAVVRKNREPA